MSLRVVVYAEGGRDLGGDGPPPAPGLALGEAELGPAHVLVHRALQQVRGVPEKAIRFEAGLRLGRGMVPRGNQLLERENLRKLCLWAVPTRAPHLVIVLVDEDADARRYEQLREHVAGISPTVVIAVAVREFESWLVADGPAASSACGDTVSMDRDIEKLARREAKECLQQWIASQHHMTDRQLRRTIAELSNLDTIAKRCPSFSRFLDDLRA